LITTLTLQTGASVNTSGTAGDKTTFNVRVQDTLINGVYNSPTLDYYNDNPTVQSDGYVQDPVLGISQLTLGAPVELLAQTNAGPLPGDANSDGSVDGSDLNTVLSNYGTTSGANWATGDFNGDGSVDGSDLNTVLSNYGTSSHATAAVPEPSTLLLAAAGLVGLLAYAWRKRR
jgi:hypothetical protein